MPLTPRPTRLARSERSTEISELARTRPGSVLRETSRDHDEKPARREADECWVVIYSPRQPELCRRFVLATDHDSYSVGRGIHCDIKVDSPAASRQHVRLDRVDDGWKVVDLGSLNGTYVNDRRITEHVLRHGDRVQIGDTIMRHLADDVEAGFAESVHAAMVTDGLTQASNERAFREALETAVERASAGGPVPVLILFDLDHFKNINDTHGHPAGDRILREFASVVRSVLPRDAGFGRVGGEEFAVLLPSATSAQGAEIAEAIRRAVLEHAFSVPDGTVRITTSLGVASPEPGERMRSLYERTDAKLYQAKHAGRNCVIV